MQADGAPRSSTPSGESERFPAYPDRTPSRQSEDGGTDRVSFWHPEPGMADQVGSAASSREATGAHPFEAVFAVHHQAWRQESLERELHATREELEAMRRLLEELPEIFERRFASRIEPLLTERERLAGETDRLRQVLKELKPASALPALPAGQSSGSGLGGVLRHAFGMQQSDRAA
jgi:hypothetical protein